MPAALEQLAVFAQFRALMPGAGKLGKCDLVCQRGVVRLGMSEEGVSIEILPGLAFGAGQQVHEVVRSNRFLHSCSARPNVEWPAPDRNPDTGLAQPTGDGAGGDTQHRSNEIAPVTVDGFTGVAGDDR
ncbi:hypothetical protein ACWD26_29645 [Streptomyces sp. NPDC002787]